ncbi:uncharacterized protein LOC124150983 isoform X1 [Haliotis rufescens]|uniref:uncharacterized protein LOC124150983 isoform X1 n=1 Tax=Haliotis rufescens TaxID=6454 RepID=UPI001EAFDDB0|nr:uncharacterized protein LOC124150983 isoform X1 [Haliotis rufescens]
MLGVTVVLVLLTFVVHAEDICAPNQWEGIQAVVTGTEEAGTLTVTQSTSRFAFDANNTRIAASTSGSRNGSLFKKDFLFLYQQRRVYIMDGGRCRAQQLLHDFPSPCLPRNFNSTWGMMWDGFVTSTDKLFMFEFEGAVGDLYCHVQVLAYTKLPVFMQQTGTVNTAPVFRTTAYTNSTLGIKNPDVFTLPSVCKTAEVEGTFDAPAYFIGLNFQ